MDEQSLNELLECSVCLERLNHTSKVLPCQHTFCRRCLDEIVLTKQELRCPECRALIETKVEDLPNNILLIRLLEGLKTCGVVSKLESEPPLRRRDNVSSTSSTSRQSNRQVKQPCAKALYDYEAKESGDLAFKKGDVVLLKKQLDDNWHQGELNGHIGFFPSSYVQVIVPLPQIPQCRALYDFDLKDEKEKDCLVFKKEDILTVMRRVDENWIEGRKGEKIGIFPLTFVELNDAAKTLVNSKPSSSILQAGSKLPTSSPRSTSAGGTTLNTVLPSTVAGSLPQQKRHSFTHTTHSSPSPPNPQRHSLELGSSGGFNILSSSVNSSIPAVSVVSTSSTSSTSNVVSLPTQRSESPDRNSPRVVSPPVQSSSPTSNLTTPYYLSVYNYKSMKDDELELKKGEYYTVNEKCQDGWFKGQCVKTGKTGVFPGNYVQMIRQPSAFKPINPNVMNIRAAEQPNSSSRSNTTTTTSSQTMSSPQSSSSPPPPPHSSSSSSSSPPLVPPPLLPRTHKSSSSTNSSNHTSSPSSSSPPSQTSGLRTVAANTHSVKKSSTMSHGPLSSTSLVAIQHSMSASSSITPPNKVAAAAGDTPQLPLKPKEKKEKKEKSGKGLSKLLNVGGKHKKYKTLNTTDTVGESSSTALAAAATAQSVDVAHSRSGSYPAKSQGATADHKKSGSFDSSVPAKPTRPKPLPREKYNCVVPYPPQTEHELDLQIGDIVYVHKKRDDGWFKGTLQRNGKTGLFPGSFVVKMD